jgi:hypothetical protein
MQYRYWSHIRRPYTVSFLFIFKQNKGVGRPSTTHLSTCLDALPGLSVAINAIRVLLYLNLFLGQWDPTAAQKRTACRSAAFGRRSKVFYGCFRASPPPLFPLPPSLLCCDALTLVQFQYSHSHPNRRATSLPPF